MKNKVLSVLLVLIVVLSCVGCSDNKEKRLKEVFEYVFDAGTYKEIDYEFAKEYFATHYDNWGGGCSAIAKTLENGDTIIGRNMDLNISNKPAYIFRTDVDGCYKTLNLAYTFRKVSSDYEYVKENGMPGELEKILPFLADDVINEKGLYIEVNMRNAEFWPTGMSKFSCPGTNPYSDERVYMFQLPRYIGEHCATVDEAIEYVKTLNVYSQNNYWTYCFLIADPSGHYGVLEFALDQVIWHDYQPCQTNFYIDEYVAAVEELKVGTGRYDLLMKNIKNVNSEDGMLNLMKRVNYYSVYDPDTCEFDVRSENVGTLPFATYDLIMKEENREIVVGSIRDFGSIVRSLTRKQQQDQNSFWESSFTEVVNCNEKTILVRFFEDDDKVIKLTLK